MGMAANLFTCKLCQLTNCPVLLLLRCDDLPACLLQALALPPAVAAEVDMATLVLCAQPFTDADALLPICYRCQATNALLNTQVGQVERMSSV
jgi:hypothetical protein